MKELKDTLCALGKYWRQWAKTLALSYSALAVGVAASVTVLLKMSLDAFFPVWELWRAHDDWDAAVKAVPVSMVWTAVLGLLVVATASAAWRAHRSMRSVIDTFEDRALVGRDFAIPALTGSMMMAAAMMVMWMPIVVIFISGDAAARSVVLGDEVPSPLWVWVVCAVSAFLATFVSEICMTVVRLMFRKVPVQ